MSNEIIEEFLVDKVDKALADYSSLLDQLNSTDEIDQVKFEKGTDNLLEEYEEVMYYADTFQQNRQDSDKYYEVLKCVDLLADTHRSFISCLEKILREEGRRK